jgi:hypothetical protein
MSLERQLRDDPIYVDLNEKDFKKAVKQFEDEYLGPLECIDRYLEYLGRDGLYTTVVSSVGDKEGRWQAFLDYYNHVWKKLDDESLRRKMNITENEVGEVEDIAFKLIRHRDIKDNGSSVKLHQVMRDLPKLLSVPDSKNELFVLNEIELQLPKAEQLKSDGVEYDEKEKDRIWSTKYAKILNRQYSKAKKSCEREKSSETPLELLEAALKKLQHQNMTLEVIKRSEIPEAMKLVREIRDTIKNIESELYDRQKSK